MGSGLYELPCISAKFDDCTSMIIGLLVMVHLALELCEDW